MNLQEIKDVYKAGEWNRNNDRFYHNPQEEKIGYLLSIIEQSESALNRIADLHIRGIEDRAAEPHRAIASEALKAIRGN